MSLVEVSYFLNAILHIRTPNFGNSQQQLHIVYYGAVLIRQMEDSVKTHFQVHYVSKLLFLKHLKQTSDALMKIRKKLLL